MSKMVNINLLEIGVWKGNSIKFWADCFPDGNITGIDNYLEYDQSVLEIPQKGKNYKILIKDAYDLKFVKSIRKKFDVIIDDGPHTWESQEFSLINYYKLLKPGGILIIEDIPSLDAAHGLIGRYDHCQLFDLREEKHRWDDIAIIRTRQ
jgi:SAM-dependent methyltransferase